MIMTMVSPRLMISVGFRPAMIVHLAFDMLTYSNCESSNIYVIISKIYFLHC